MTFRIMFPSQGSWTEIPGHGCSTLEEAEDYVSQLSPGLIVARDGEPLPPCPAPVKRELFRTPMSELTPEQQEQRRDLVDRVLKAFKDV